MRAMRLIITAVLVFSWGATSPTVFASVTDEEVGQAIDQLKKYLYYKQDPRTGSWEFRSRSGGVASDALQVGGETALVTLALLTSGESAQNPKIMKALQYLRSIDMRGVYAVAIRAHVWAQLPPDYMPMLENDASWLLDCANKHKLGLFDYQPKASDRVDHSTTQYGMLGLWEASKRGLKIPRKYWERWVEHFIGAQKADGGWTYSQGDLTTGSMTAAGLTALYVGRQELYRDDKAFHPKFAQALKRGVAWLDRNFKGVTNTNANEWTYYYLYGIERVALGSGLRFFNGKDWYQTGASHIVRIVRDTGSIEDDYVNSAFALMFLSRGRVPVWINKLMVPGHEWNKYPNDLYFLTQYLSNQVEQEINWQVLSIDLPPEEWLVAPIAYLSSDRALELTRDQKKAIKKYIDLGGLLLANPNKQSAEFSDSIRALAAELYPQYELKRLPSDHTLYHCWHHLAGGDDDQTIFSLSNGARELIVMPQQDWGRSFQSDKEPGQTPAWDLVTNIFAYATDRGALSNRLVQPIEKRRNRSAVGNMTIGRARYEGNWLPETGVWGPQSNYVFNRTGIDITTTAASGAGVLDLDRIGKSNLKLIHLTGTHAITLTDPQRDAIKQYVSRGGTLLIETVGGHGEFSRSLQKQLAAALNSFAVPLTSADPIISGQGLDGGEDTSRALYRRYAVVKFQFDPRPRLAAFLDEQSRPMIILSHEDLSLGMISSRHWNILGYQPTTSRKIMNNIVKWAHQQEMSR